MFREASSELELSCQRRVYRGIGAQSHLCGCDPSLTMERCILMQTEHLSVSGMSCGGCTSKLTRALKAVVGVSDVEVSLATGKATVKYDERTASPVQLKAAVEGAGYGVASTTTAQPPQSRGCCCGNKTASDKVEPVMAATKGVLPPRMPERSTLV